MDYHRKCQEILDQATPKYDGCLIWQGPTDGNGYGYMYYAGKRWLVHKFVALYNTERPVDSVMRLKKFRITKTCGKPVCIAPKHLEFTATKPAKVYEDLVEWWKL